jgi:hypothetical protein
MNFNQAGISMKRSVIKRAFAALTSVAAAAMLSSAANAQVSVPAGVIPPHLSTETSRYYSTHPDAWSAFVAKLPRINTRATPNPNRYWPGAGGTWSLLTGSGVPGGICNPQLLHNGIVLAQSCNAKQWYKLTPNSTGSYAKGAWTAIASLPVIGGTQYAPLYHASVVLPDGRLIIEGGEYNGSGTEVWTSLGAIYSPSTNKWTAVTAPAGSTIGDSESVVLTNGSFMLGPCCDNPDTDWLLNVSTLKWTKTGSPNAGQDYQDEQGYELLPDGNVLTIDVWTNYPSGGATNAEQYSPGNGAWSSAGNTPVSLVDPAVCNNWEIGPAVVRGNGTLVAFGGNTGCDKATSPKDPIALLNTKTVAWSSAPDVPSVCGSGKKTACDLADAPAALLSNGNILFAASSGYGAAPTHFFEMTLTNTISQVADPLTESSGRGAYTYNFLVLPTGQILVTDFNTPEIYTPSGASVASWAPTITSAPATVTRGTTYTISGKGLAGVSAGSYYGDDEQAATNFPLVRVVNTATGHVTYGTTSAFSTFSVAPGASGSFSFSLPTGTATGASKLYVVANGIPSAAKSITVN